MEFATFKRAIAAQFARMQEYTLFRVDIDKATLWETYLGSYPPGTNPIYRERTEHDCNCCKGFIRTVGNVVAVIDGKLVSVWDIYPRLRNANDGFQIVADAMSRLVKSRPIADRFLHYERTAGTDKSFESLVNGGQQRWDHFFVNIDEQFVLQKSAIPTKLNEYRTAKGVLERSLREIEPEVIDMVLDMIAQNSLYRGAEHKAALVAFQTLQKKWAELGPDNATFAWTADAMGSVNRMRNTVIGTLLVDLSEGKDLESSVRAYESKVAPANYKRPTALVTPAMIKKAKEQVEALGLTSALQRRYARLEDLTINNIVFADRTTRKALGDNPFDDLLVGKAAPAKGLDRIEEVPVAKFFNDILPRVESIEVLLENKHAPNLVSLIAPEDPTAGRLFKWDNQFSWSYSGDMADAIKERVKAAGGNVTGDLCCRLAWSNYDDLDLHLHTPQGGHIYYGNRTEDGGMLDTDMNGMNGRSRTPVENIFFHSRTSLSKRGEYRLQVNQYNKRETADVGFEAQIDFMGTVYQFSYPKPVTGSVLVARFKYTGDGIELIESLPAAQASRELWGVPSQTFVPVRAVMLSPNHWDENNVGNLHYFFMLHGCKNDGTARGFYNEFLKGELDPHRKVLEMVGSKLKTEASDEQLSGLGFSETVRNTLTCRVKGSFNRTVKVIF